MQITVHFLGQARHLAPSGQTAVEAAENSSVDGLISTLLSGAPAPLRALLADGPRLRRSVMAIVGEETIDPSEEGLLQDGDELSLLPPMSGG